MTPKNRKILNTALGLNLSAQINRNSLGQEILTVEVEPSMMQTISRQFYGYGDFSEDKSQYLIDIS
jgi:hypothetical protein